MVDAEPESVLGMTEEEYIKELKKYLKLKELKDAQLSKRQRQNTLTKPVKAAN